MENNCKVSKVVVIREEYVKITGNYISALILNQLIYWTQKKNFNAYIEEINTSNSKEYGWIYKKADELSEELMLGISGSSIRKYLRILIEQGFVDERTNPTVKMDQTLQYRVNLKKVMESVVAAGFSFSLNQSEQIKVASTVEKEKVEVSVKPADEIKATENVSKALEICNQTNYDSNQNNLKCNEKTFDAIPEIIAKTIKESLESIYLSNISNTKQEMTEQDNDRLMEELQWVTEIIADNNLFERIAHDDLAPEIESILKDMYTSSSVKVDGDYKPKAVVQSVISKLTKHHIYYVAKRYREISITERIKCPKYYLQSMIFNSVHQMNAQDINVFPTAI